MNDMHEGFYAFAPVSRNAFAVDLIFAPRDNSEEFYADAPGNGLLRVTDGEIELIKYTPSTARPNFVISYADILEAFNYLINPDY